MAFNVRGRAGASSPNDRVGSFGPTVLHFGTGDQPGKLRAVMLRLISWLEAGRARSLRPVRRTARQQEEARRRMMGASAQRLATPAPSPDTSHLLGFLHHDLDSRPSVAGL